LAAQHVNALMAVRENSDGFSLEGSTAIEKATVQQLADFSRG